MGLTVSDAACVLVTRMANEGALPLELVSNSDAHDAWFRAKVLQAEQPGQYPDHLLRTLQRRVKIWRKEKAHAMVFGAMQSRR